MVTVRSVEFGNISLATCMEAPVNLKNNTQIEEFFPQQGVKLVLALKKSRALNNDYEISSIKQ